MRKMCKELISIDDNPIIRNLRQNECPVSYVVTGTLGSGYKIMSLQSLVTKRLNSSQLLRSYLNESSRLGGVKIPLNEWNHPINPLHTSPLYFKDKMVKQ